MNQENVTNPVGNPAPSNRPLKKYGCIAGGVIAALVCLCAIAGATALGVVKYRGAMTAPTSTQTEGTTQELIPSPENTESTPAEEQPTETAAIPDPQPTVMRPGIGIILPSNDQPNWIMGQTAFQTTLAAAGYSPDILFSQHDPAKEKANMEELISKGDKVIILCPVGSNSAAAVNKAGAAGVKIVSYDQLIRNSSAVSFYVRFDSMAVGAAMGDYLNTKAGSTKGNNLYLYAGAAGDSNAFDFFEGSWESMQPKFADGTFLIKNSSAAVYVKGKPTLTHGDQAAVLAQINTKWDNDYAGSLARKNLGAASAADKGAVFILAPNDGTARAIADAFAADPDVTNYFITGQDAARESIQSIIDGKQSMTVLKDVRVLAKDACAAAIALLEGNTPPSDTTVNNGALNVPTTNSALTVVTKENVKAAMFDSGYYNASEFTGLP
jgi:putative multiple sugar transport system substrate-binding protein